MNTIVQWIDFSHAAYQQRHTHFLPSPFIIIIIATRATESERLCEEQKMALLSTAYLCVFIWYALSCALYFIICIQYLSVGTFCSVPCTYTSLVCATFFFLACLYVPVNFCCIVLLLKAIATRARTHSAYVIISFLDLCFVFHNRLLYSSSTRATMIFLWGFTHFSCSCHSSNKANVILP